MKERENPGKWPPLVEAGRLSPLVVIRDMLLTAGMWFFLAYLLRDLIVLLWDYFTFPRFTLSFTEPPDWGALWLRMRAYAIFVLALVAWLVYWGLARRRSLADSTPKPQPAPLEPAAHAAALGLPESAVVLAQGTRLQVAEFGEDGKLIRLRPHQPGLPKARLP